jgi:hypothetical protein
VFGGHYRRADTDEKLRAMSDIKWTYPEHAQIFLLDEGAGDLRFQFWLHDGSAFPQVVDGSRDGYERAPSSAPARGNFSRAD